MKILVSILVLAAFVFTVVKSNAQAARGIRFDSAGNHGDNTFRALNLSYKTLVDQAGPDSAVLVPHTYENIYYVQLLDSFTLKQPVITADSTGDVIKLFITAASGTPFLKFTGSNWITQGKLTLTTNKTGFINLFFDGTYWRETGRITY